MDRNPQPTSASGRVPSSQTLRLRFEYDGSNVRLVSSQSVEMITPPATVPLSTGQSGFWYELRDGEDRLLYQRALSNPIRFDAEVFSDDPNDPIRRQPLDHPHGVFELLVPDRPDGATVVLYGSPPTPEEAHLPAIEVHRVDLRQARQREEE